MMKRILGILSLALLGLGGPAGAAWPDKPIRVLVPQNPGSMPDVLIRLLSEEIGKQLGQPLVIENRSGASGTIAVTAASRAEPDGYTLLVAGTSVFFLNKPLFGQLDAIAAFDPITVMADVPAVMFVSAQVPARTFADFVAYAKANPGKLNSGSSGVSIALPIEQINRAKGLGMAPISYRGAGQVMAAVVANEVQFTLAGAGIGLEQVKAGNVRTLAVSGKSRLALLPDTPTFAEIGLQDVHVDTFWGVAAPTGTPKAILERWNQAFRAAIASPAIKERFGALGVIGVGSTREQMAERLRKDGLEWAHLIKEVDLKAK